jgi:hypothetical protein
MQQKIQLGLEKDEESQKKISDLQAQLHLITTESHKQCTELAIAIEDANASRHNLHVSAQAAKTILDQLQMTNESSRDYGSTLLEVDPP